jgi:hypothetical protein
MLPAAFRRRKLLQLTGASRFNDEAATSNPMGHHNGVDVEAGGG